MERILGFDGEYRFLSNFWPSQFQGKLPFNNTVHVFKTVEHFYQAAKAMYLADALKVVYATTPGRAKRFGGKIVLRPDWDSIKDEVMLMAVRAKFFSNKELADALLATGDAYLEETNTWGDTYWGVCNGKGLNKLGLILMQVRDELRRMQS